MVLFLCGVILWLIGFIFTFGLMLKEDEASNFQFVGSNYVRDDYWLTVIKWPWVLTNYAIDYIEDRWVN